MTVLIKCTGSNSMALSEMVPFQGNLKELSEKNYLKLKEQILKNGYSAPIFLWNKNILDGHARYLALSRMKEEGISMPDKFPVNEIQAENETQAKKLILAYSSQYNQMTEEGLFEFSHEINLDFKELEESFTFDSIDFQHYGENFFFLGEGETLGHENRGPNSEEKLEKYIEKGFQEIKLYYDIETYQQVTKKLDDKMLIEGLQDIFRMREKAASLKVIKLERYLETEIVANQKPNKILGELITENTEIYSPTGELILKYIQAPMEIRKMAREIALEVKITKSARTSKGTINKSAVFGVMPRIAIREDYCRFTNSCREQLETYKKVLRLNERLSAFYQEILPQKYTNALEFIKTNIAQKLPNNRKPLVKHFYKYEPNN